MFANGVQYFVHLPWNAEVFDKSWRSYIITKAHDFSDLDTQSNGSPVWLKIQYAQSWQQIVECFQF